MTDVLSTVDSCCKIDMVIESFEKTKISISVPLVFGPRILWLERKGKMNVVVANAPSGVGTKASKIHLEQRLKEAINEKEIAEVSACKLVVASVLWAMKTTGRSTRLISHACSLLLYNSTTSSRRLSKSNRMNSINSLVVLHQCRSSTTVKRFRAILVL